MSQLKNFFDNRGERAWLPAIVIGGGAFFCVAILAIGSLFISRRVASSDLPGVDGTKGLVVTLSGKLADSTTATSRILTLTAEDDGLEATNTPEPAPQEEATVRTIARFGAICFKPAIDDRQAETCADTYPPVVEIHAIFNYAGMSPHDEWTRVWYHNGQEVLRVKENWTGDVEGQFDYNLNTSDGQPLSPGLWQLELYVDVRLQTFGSFVIETPAAPTETPTREAAAESPTPSPVKLNYQLAFTRWDGGKHAIWVADLDGGNQQFLLDFAASPSWSADEQHLVFYGEEGIDTQPALDIGTNGIWRMGAGGETPTQLLPEGSGQAVAWSPVDDLVAFDAARGGPDRRVYFIDANGGHQNFEILGQQPAWSPDGMQLVVKVCRPQCGLWISNRDATDPRQLTGEGSDGLPAWSPDGDRIAFSRNVDGNVDIFVIKVDGTGLQRLTSTPGNDSVPAWTPDGRQLVFRTTRNGLWQIFLMNADGSNQHLIIDDVGASDEWAFDRMSVR